MFENPRRDRQARNFTTNVPKIVDFTSRLPNRYFPKIDVRCPRLIPINKAIKFSGNARDK